MLLLFDIDGTLLLAHGAGRRLIEDALTRAAGKMVSGEGVRFSGRTDPDIAHDMVTAAGFANSESASIVDRGLQLYAEQLGHRLAQGPVTVLPGVRSLLARLHQIEGVELGVLTGNLKSTGNAKLAAAGLEEYFPFGAFGSDSSDRNDLPAVALARASDHLGRPVSPLESVVIGDTEHDVGCARAGRMHAVAVCTGHVGWEDLEASKPDLLIRDLADPGPLMRFLGLD